MWLWSKQSNNITEGDQPTLANSLCRKTLTWFFISTTHTMVYPSSLTSEPHVVDWVRPNYSMAIIWEFNSRHCTHSQVIRPHLWWIISMEIVCFADLTWVIVVVWWCVMDPHDIACLREWLFIIIAYCKQINESVCRGIQSTRSDNLHHRRMNPYTMVPQ